MVNFLRRRLQIFVSSTYTDLQPERQSAVEAILVAGHIPAGMELFTAGDESQMEVIRQWIDESDVYMLILGGRYGSMDSASGKSYTHLEYDYAVSKGKPVFSLVVTDEGLDRLVSERGRSVLERDNPQGLKLLRAQAQSRLVRFWGDGKDIRIAVGETLSTFARRDDLNGWVRPEDQSNVPQLASEIARLSRENSDLRDRFLTSENATQPLGIGYKGVLKILQSEGVLERLIQLTPRLIDRRGVHEDEETNLEPLRRLLELGLVKRRLDAKYLLILAEEGMAFLNWLKLKSLESAGTDLENAAESNVPAPSPRDI